jgi:hypothetical protein
MSTGTHTAPPAVSSRPLTTREIATIRAALRVWTELDEVADAALIDHAHAEIGSASVVSDAEIERLILDLSVAGDVVLTSDARRI